MAINDLGIGLMQRARQRQQEFSRQQGPGRMIQTVLPDPKWSGYFQALQEAGVDRLADQSVGEAKGMFEPSMMRPSMGPLLGQTEQRQQKPKLKPKQESHEDFMNRYGR